MKLTSIQNLAIFLIFTNPLIAIKALDVSPLLQKTAREAPYDFVNYIYAISTCMVQQGRTTEVKASSNNMKLFSLYGINSEQVANLTDHKRIKQLISEEGGCYKLSQDVLNGN